MDTHHYFIQRHRTGTLLADGQASSIRFVINGRNGELVFPADAFILNADELVLAVPEESPECDHEMQVLLTAGVTEAERTGLRDRWIAYHGPVRSSQFASCRVDGVRFLGEVLEPWSLLNTVIGSEGRLLRTANADKARLRSACSRRGPVLIPDPVAVGADQHGIEVRATFGVSRLFFARTAENESDATALLDALLGDGP